MQNISSVTFLLFDAFSNHCLANSLEPFRAANDLSGSALFDWKIATIDGENVKSSSGLEFVPQTKLSNSAGDLLIVMPSYGFLKHSVNQNMRAIRAAAGRFDCVAGFDTGSWLLAQAGLLDGYAATIHWDEFTRFSEAFPTVDAKRERLIWDRNRLTCAGAASAFDVSLDIVGQQHGRALKLEIALLFMGSDLMSESHGYIATPGQVSKAIHLMRENLEQPLSISKIAQSVGLSGRSLNDRVKREVGETAIQVYRRLRLLMARKLLLETDIPISEIAVRTGYENISAMTRAFRITFGTTPGKLR